MALKFVFILSLAIFRPFCMACLGGCALLVLLVNGVVVDASCCQSLFSLHAGSAFAAMLLAALVAAPCLGVVYVPAVAAPSMALMNSGRQSG